MSADLLSDVMTSSLTIVKFKLKTLTFHRFYCMIILNIFGDANRDFVLLNNSGTFQREISPLLVI